MCILLRKTLLALMEEMVSSCCYNKCQLYTSICKFVSISGVIRCNLIIPHDESVAFLSSWFKGYVFLWDKVQRMLEQFSYIWWPIESFLQISVILVHLKVGKCVFYNGFQIVTSCFISKHAFNERNWLLLLSILHVLQYLHNLKLLPVDYLMFNIHIIKCTLKTTTMIPHSL